MQAAKLDLKSDSLDNPAYYEALDPNGLRDRLRTFPDQCFAGWQQSLDWKTTDSWTGIRHVVIGGMGGSAIAGDLIRDLAAVKKSLPITVVRDFQLPCNMDQHTLFIACSFSGNTEETLSLVSQVQETEAKILVVSSGGQLQKIAQVRGVPILGLPGFGEPRSSVGYTLLLLLGVLNKLGIFALDQHDVSGSIGSLRSTVAHLSEGVPTLVNPAKRLAYLFQQKTLVVYGGGIFSATARRWKTQFNENSKAWAFYEELPELLHNSVEAFQLAETFSSSVVIVLEPKTKTPMLEARYRVVEDLLRSGHVQFELVRGESGSPIAQVLNMVLLGDYASYYLGLLHGINPSATPAIDQGKKLLAKYGK